MHLKRFLSPPDPSPSIRQLDLRPESVLAREAEIAKYGMLWEWPKPPRVSFTEVDAFPPFPQQCQP